MSKRAGKEQQVRSSAQEDPRKGEGGQSERVPSRGRLSSAEATPSMENLPPTKTGVNFNPVQFSANTFRGTSLRDVGRDGAGRVIKHVWSSAIASKILQWAGMGADENYICHQLNMRPGTLKELYSAELAHGTDHVVQNVAERLYRDALVPGSFNQQRFLLKARGRWKDGENVSMPVSPLNIIIHD